MNITKILEFSGYRGLPRNKTQFTRKLNISSIIFDLFGSLSEMEYKCHKQSNLQKKTNWQKRVMDWKIYNLKCFIIVTTNMNTNQNLNDAGTYVTFMLSVLLIYSMVLILFLSWLLRLDEVWRKAQSVERRKKLLFKLYCYQSILICYYM